MKKLTYKQVFKHHARIEKKVLGTQGSIKYIVMDYTFKNTNPSEHFYSQSAIGKSWNDTADTQTIQELQQSAKQSSYKI